MSVCVEGFRAEKAISPRDGSVSWVVISSQTYGLQAEGSAYLASLRALDRSPNTERAYSGRVALYLSYCKSWGINWASPAFTDLVGFGRWLVDEPLPDRSAGGRVEPLFRSGKTANAVMTVVAEFLRFGFSHGWVEAGTVALLAEPQWLRFVPPGYGVGESGQFRLIRARTIKFSEVEPGFRWLSPEQVHRLVALCRRARDRFLLTLLADTGLFSGAQALR